MGTDPEHPVFAGHAVVGIDLANPSKLVIDAGFDELTAWDISLGLLGQDVEGTVLAPTKAALENAKLKDVRLTLVPGAAGVELFGVRYDQGLMVQGVTQIGHWKGRMFLAGSPGRLAGAVSIDPIRAGEIFELTGFNGHGGPSLEFLIEPSPNARVAFQGQARLLGLKAAAAMRMTGEGFDMVVDGDLFNGTFGANLSVAGRSPTAAAGIYVKATLTSRLDQLKVVGPIVKNTFNIQEAQFQGCIGAVTGAEVQLGVKGEIFRKRFATTVGADLTKPASAMKGLVKALIKGEADRPFGEPTGSCAESLAAEGAGKFADAVAVGNFRALVGELPNPEQWADRGLSMAKR